MRRPRSWYLPALCVVLAAGLAACSSPTDGTPPEPSRGGTSAAVATSDAPSPAGSSPSPTPTPTPSPEPLRLSVLGDVSGSDAAAAVLDSIHDRDDDLTLVVGDLSYGDPGEESSWCRFVDTHLGRNYPFEIVSGNHDDDGPNGVIDAFTACLPDRLGGLHGDYGRQWYADLPADDPVVRVVMISPGLDFGAGVWSYEKGTPRYAWTRQAIEGAHDAGIPWVVAGMHVPCLSVGNYGCTMGPDLMNLLVAEHVDLVVTGHEHLYQRTARLALGPSCPQIRPDHYDAACVTDHGGTTVVTVGTGGIPLRDAHLDDAERPWFRAVSAANEHPAHGSLAVTVDADRLTATFEPVMGATFTDTLRLRR